MTILRQCSPADLERLISPEVLGTVEEQSVQIMRDALSRSAKVWVGIGRECEVFGFCGVVPPTLMADCAYLWLYTTPAIEKYKFMFLRHSQIVIREMLSEYQLIVGHTLRNADRSINWLRWLGADYIEADDKFLRFEIRAA